MTETESRYWRTLRQLFHGALDIPESRRREWLEDQCPDSPEQVEEVLELLERHDTDDERVDRAVSGIARDVDRPDAVPESRKLGPYRIIEALGRGGMGTVYLAERDDDEYITHVAIKLIRGFPGDEALERLRRERQILADLSHPNIAGLLDGGSTEDGQPYLVMEYIDGVPITQWCRDQELDRHARIRLFMAVCDGVHYAHQNLVIHRDIKPGNVLVTREGRPMLLDFGIAKLLSTPTASAEQTTRYYTPGYASPEQLDGQPVTTACDVYSLGRLLLALLGFEDDARRPPEDEALGRTLWQRQLPRDLAAIIDQSTRSEPERRYSSVAALKADLLNYLEGRAVDAVASSFAYRLGKFVRRHRTAVAAAVLALVVTATMAWQWLGEYQSARLAEATAAREAQHAGQVLDFLIDIIGSASPEQSLDRDVTVAEVLERGYRTLQESPGLDPELEHRMLLALGEVYQQLEAYDQADELLERAGQSSEPEVRARALSLLGYVRTRHQRFDEAEAPFRKALAMIEQDAEVSAGTRLSLRNHWGLWLLETGDAEAARAQFSSVVDESRKRSENETRTARFLHNLALSEQRLGRNEAAAELYREALAIMERTVGESHPDYALSQRLLAQILRRLGDHRGAQQATEQSVQTRIRLFGEDHPGLHADYNELANAHHDLGEFEEAIGLYESALEWIESLDAESFARAIYTNNLASAHRDRGDPERATALFRDSLELRQRILGDEHASVAIALHNLAGNLLMAGALDEAEALINEAIAMRTRLFDEDHQATQYSHALAGRLAALQGDFQSAEDRQRQALRKMSEHLPDTNLWMLTVRGDLAGTLIERGSLEEAEAMLTETVELYREALDPDHPLAAALEVDLARIELLDGRAESAQERLARTAPLLQASMVSDSEVLRQLDCLQQERIERNCWRNHP